MTPRQIRKYYRDLWLLKWGDRVWAARCAGSEMEEPDWPEEGQESKSSTSAQAEEDFKSLYRSGKWRGHLKQHEGRVVGLDPRHEVAQVEGRLFR